MQDGLPHVAHDETREPDEQWTLVQQMQQGSTDIYVPPHLRRLARDSATSSSRRSEHEEEMRRTRFVPVPVSASGDDCPEAVHEPEQLRALLDPYVFRNLERRSRDITRGHALRTFPTLLQAHAIPIIYAKRDALAVLRLDDLEDVMELIAPVVSLLHQQNAPVEMAVPHPDQAVECEVQPRAMIITFTSHMVTRLLAELHQLGQGGTLRFAALTLNRDGGASQHTKHEQVDIVVATLTDALGAMQSGRLSLRRLQCLVIHGVDKLLEVESTEPFDRLLRMMPERASRHTIVISEVLPRAVIELTSRLTHNAIRLIVGGCPGTPPGTKPIDHSVVMVTNSTKLTTLVDILHGDGFSNDSGSRGHTTSSSPTQSPTPSVSVSATRSPTQSPTSSVSASASAPRTLIFTSSSKEAQFLQSELVSARLPAVLVTHEGQVWRDPDGGGDNPILITTEYVVRGFKGSFWRVKPQHVINYSLPSDIDVLVWRVGSVGLRFYDSHGSGRVTTLVPEEGCQPEALRNLMDLLRENEQQVPAWLERLVNSAPCPPRKERSGGWW